VVHFYFLSKNSLYLFGADRAHRYFSRKKLHAIIAIMINTAYRLLLLMPFHAAKGNKLLLFLPAAVKNILWDAQKLNFRLLAGKSIKSAVYWLLLPSARIFFSPAPLLHGSTALRLRPHRCFLIVFLSPIPYPHI
jgi:hypothetical protein